MTATRVLITGAAGFSGRHLVSYLRTLPQLIEIVGLGRRTPKGVDLDSFLKVDITDSNAVRSAVQSTRPEKVFHLAGAVPPASESEMWQINVGGTLNLLQALSEIRDRPTSVVSVGSAAEYQPSCSAWIGESEPCGGQSPYGRSKWVQTRTALACGKEWGLKLSIARPFNLLGPGLPSHLVAGSVCHQLAQPGCETINLGDLSPLRDFIDVRDAVAGYWLLSEKGRRNQVYNVCRKQATRIRTLVGHLTALYGGSVAIREKPSHHRVAGVSRACGDNSKLCALGWKPTITLRQSARDMLNYK
jgi:GDP-4-dehydro-6-deoxy-D-mannose reductase